MNPQQQLLAMRDETYATFVAKIIPNIPPTDIIGVRSPQLQQLFKQLKDTPEASQFIATLPHRYIEENNLHALIISNIKDPTTCLQHIQHFMPHINNWATCDTLRPTCFNRHPDPLLQHIPSWLTHPHEYTVRLAIGMLNSYFLKDNTFRSEHLQWVADIDRPEYYIRMMQAWYFATALTHQPTATLPYLTQHQLTPWVHRKTIQKAIESRRISDTLKQQLRLLR